MKKLSAAAIFLAGTLTAQNISSSRWSDLFSYNNVIAIRQDSDRLIAATENGIFYYTPKTGEIKKLSKANGLHEVKITAFDYDPVTKTGLVGYERGSMDVITPEGITYVVDIPIAKGYIGRKAINHISITGNRAAVSADYGVSVFNLDRKEFGDTAFFMNGSIYEPSKEAVIRDNTVYAITAAGLKKHDINVTFPIYAEWQTVAGGAFTNIDVENGLIAYSNQNQVWYGDGSTFNALPQGFSDVQDISVFGLNVVVTDESILEDSGSRKYIATVSVYTNGQQAAQKSFQTDLNTAFFDSSIYAGSRYDGILDVNLKSYKPDGPYLNNASSLSLLEKNRILVSTGRRDEGYFHPNRDSRNIGFYYFDGARWVYPSIFYRNQFASSPTTFNVLDVTEYPASSGVFFFTNFTEDSNSGFYRMNSKNVSGDVSFEKFYKAPNPVGFAFDDQQNLFFDKALNTDYGFYDKQNDQFAFKNLTAASVAPTKPKYYGGFLWMPSPRGNNMVVMDLNKTPLNLNDDTKYIIDAKNNIPEITRVISIAFDKYGAVWLGTLKGLRVLNDYSRITQNPKFEPVVITQNGRGEELFRDAQVLHIEVDDGNKKWISIGGGGAFYLSSDGQQTLLHFTKENSPLPNNSVTDIKVDRTTGKVYFATLDGIVVYNGDTAEVGKDFKNVLVYPNPVVNAQYKGNVHIRGLAEKTNIRITDAAGNVVHQAVARGGTYEWDLISKGKRVASGVYFVLMTNEDGTDTATAKIAVVN